MPVAPIKMSPQFMAAQAAHLPSLHVLLAEAGLVTGDLPATLPDAQTQFLLAQLEGAIAGAVGLEHSASQADSALLRSLVVAPAARGTGLGTALLGEAESLARAQGVKQLYLLTTTAAAFFARHGYVICVRDAAPAGIAHSRQFSALCPGSSTLMRKALT
jgi:N-acetylglutamate synthase-like GNAT family acetyltransferase